MHMRFKKLNKIYSLPVLPVTKQQQQSQLPVCFTFPKIRLDEHRSFGFDIRLYAKFIQLSSDV